ncbi:MAG: CehA/McbA family metallohydrolase [Clostridiales bacterium]|nr:CehA/McbA family metallohydrolase [Clostridiales bacterium]
MKHSFLKPILAFILALILLLGCVGSAFAEEYKHYYGDLHAHTGYSDGASGTTPAQAYAAAKAQGLDFFAVTDHCSWLAPFGAAQGVANPNAGNNLWRQGHEQANAAYIPGIFATLHGYEFTWSSANPVYGHINTFNTVGLISRSDSNWTGTDNGRGLLRWYDEMVLHPQSINQFNHPGNTFGRFGTQAGGPPQPEKNFLWWTPLRDQVMHLIEVGNGTGNVNNLGNNDGPGSGNYYRQTAEYTIALDKGWHVAPTNVSDHHGTAWGSFPNRTVILAEELTRESLYEAVRQRRVYATENKGMKVNYTCNGEVMGTRIQVPAGTTLNITVEAEDTGRRANVGTVELRTNGNALKATGTINAYSGTWTTTITTTAAETYYFVKIIQPRTPAEWTFTAPVWVETTATDPTGLTGLTVSHATPKQGDPLTLTTTLFNNSPRYGDANFKVTSVVYKDAGGAILSQQSNPCTAIAGSTATHTANITATKPGLNTVTVTVTGTYAGLPKTYTGTVSFTVSGEQGPTPTPGGPLPGDANCDTQVDAADAAAILRYLVQLADLTPQGKLNAKVTKPFDAPVSAADAARILRWLVQLEKDLVEK